MFERSQPMKIQTNALRNRVENVTAEGRLAWILLCAAFLVAFPHWAFAQSSCTESCSWQDASDWGKAVTCQSPNVSFGLCGSGGNMDCVSGSTKVSNQIYCCHGPQWGNYTGTTRVKTNEFGKRIQCSAGQVVVALCGSGKNKDCDGDVNWIDCATVPDMKLGSDGTWYSTADFGGKVFCPNATVMTGMCGSGKNRDCPDGMVNEIRCTTYTLN